jgi:hypothetical protein
MWTTMTALDNAVPRMYRHKEVATAILLQNVCLSTTSSKAKKLMNIFGTTRYPVQNVWIWMIFLVSCVTSSSQECLEVFLDFYKLSGFDLHQKLVKTIEEIVSVKHSYNYFDIVIGLAIVKDVWFSFRNYIYVWSEECIKFVTQFDIITSLINFYLNPMRHNENIAWVKFPVNDYKQTQLKTGATRFFKCDFYQNGTDDLIYSTIIKHISLYIFYFSHDLSLI